MAKLTLTDVTAGYASVSKLNANNSATEAAVENTLSRDGTGPNAMEAVLDMNQNRIINLPNAISNSEPVTLNQANVLAGVTNPLTQESVGAVLYPRTAAEIAAGVTPTNYAYPPGNVLRYGTNTTPGTTDMTAAFTSLFSVYAGTAGAGGDVVIPPGTYHLATQVTVTAPANARLSIRAYGAEITTAGAISGLHITGPSVTGGVTVYGLQINHRGNATATAGFEFSATWNARLVDCSVESHDTGSGYASYWLRQSTPATVSTGCFWTLLDNCHNRRRSTGDGTRSPCAVRIQGSCNATTIRGGNLSDADVGVHHTIESGQTYLANGLVIDGAAFEGYTTAYHLEGSTNSDLLGCRIVNCRFENGTTVYSFTGTTKQPAVPHYIAGNHYITNAGTYLDNANSLYVNSLDFSVTPDGRQQLSFDDVFKIRNLGNATNKDALQLRAATGGGLALNNVSDTEIAYLRARTGGADFGGGFTAAMRQVGIASISRGTTASENLRGTVTLASGTADVTFATAEPDASYFIALGGSAGESFSWASKTTAGFTVNSSNGSSTAVVNWILIR